MDDSVNVGFAGAIGLLIGTLADPISWAIVLAVGLPARRYAKKTVFSYGVYTGLVFAIVFAVMMLLQLVLLNGAPFGQMFSHAILWATIAVLIVILRAPSPKVSLGKARHRASNIGQVPLYIAEIEHLAALKDRGVITEEEFALRKKAILEYQGRGN